jgi:hypothetical protein
MDHGHGDSLPRMGLCQPSTSCTFTRLKDGHLAGANRWKRATAGWDVFRGAVALAEHCTSAPLTLPPPRAMLNCRTACSSGDSPEAAVASAPI